MSKTKEFDVLAEKATNDVIKEMYNICEWTLTGTEVDHLIEDTDINEAHSYLMALVASKLADKFKFIENE
jgi:hypothetical protein